MEYLYEQVGYDITPYAYYPETGTGKDDTQTYNCEWTGGGNWAGENTFAEQVEFSRFEHPMVELIEWAVDIGVVYDGGHYMFFPYTQYLQPTLEDTITDVPVSGGGDSDDDGGKCFIATAAYGSPLHPYLDILRAVRDRYMKTNAVGRLFLSVYERNAPSLADLIERHEVLKSLTRVALLPVLGLCLVLLYAGPAALLVFLAVLFILPFRLARR